MKFLCLHGYGTSGAIFEKQITAIRYALGDEHEWVFLDGEVAVEKSELTDVLPGPHLAFYEGTDSEPVHEAQELISAVIAEDGPFDGIVGFSQGASLSISYMLQHQRLYPAAPAPFRFGVFFSPGFVISPDPTYQDSALLPFLNKLTPTDLRLLHSDLIHKRHVIDPKLLGGFDQMTDEERSTAVELLSTAAAVLGTRQALQIDDWDPLLNGTAVDEVSNDQFPRFFHPIYTKERVTVPSVHVLGRKDNANIRRLANIAQGLCSATDTVVYEHEGVHEIPKKPKDVKAIVDAIKQASLFGQVGGQHRQVMPKAVAV